MYEGVPMTHDTAGACRPLLIQLLRQTKVGDLGLALLRQQHIGRLEVAMDHLRLMGRVDRLRQALDQLCRLLRSQRVFLQQSIKRTA
jgi:hypothetical protein